MMSMYINTFIFTGLVNSEPKITSQEINNNDNAARSIKKATFSVKFFYNTAGNYSFINVVCWGKQAEDAMNLKIGMDISISGILKINENDGYVNNEVQVKTLSFDKINENDAF